MDNDTRNLVKRCSKCKQEFPATPEYFQKDKSKRDGLYSSCKECNKLYYLANCEHVKAKQKEWHKSNREKANAYSLAWREANLERSKISQKKWQQANREKCRAKYHRRRAREKTSLGHFTDNDLALQYKSQKGKCWHCGVELNGVYDTDHLVPLSKGGTNSPNNIVCSCITCNRSKGGKTTIEWNGKLF